MDAVCYGGVCLHPAGLRVVGAGAGAAVRAVVSTSLQDAAARSMQLVVEPAVLHLQQLHLARVYTRDSTLHITHITNRGMEY